MNIENGSRWSSSNGKEFVVINVVTTEDGHEWVYYRDALGEPPREYSCYTESFLSRLTKLPD